ncbi:von Willebrand factor A domain-containing protein 5A [Lachnellula arida]|uniref:von Willebrand factor A domain-containing protein 5A n=1 Tax=Lachnellula arida TaxID=1316785 RepID=A0A8T9BGJ0_9HELO|nr:von Willebrand factor A domain-containing protein 5A [Lachnellula arida]
MPSRNASTPSLSTTVEKVITGLVREKVKAKAIFNAVVTEGETARLLEQAPESLDVFSTKLSNIPAGESVIVKVTYIGELKHYETDGIKFTIPTSIAPRYSSRPSISTLKPYINLKSEVQASTTPTINVSGIKISPSYPIAVLIGTVSTANDAISWMSKASATLSLGSAALEKDFVLFSPYGSRSPPKRATPEEERFDAVSSISLPRNIPKSSPRRSAARKNKMSPGYSSNSPIDFNSVLATMEHTSASNASYSQGAHPGNPAPMGALSSRPTGGPRGFRSAVVFRGGRPTGGFRGGRPTGGFRGGRSTGVSKGLGSEPRAQMLYTVPCLSAKVDWFSKSPAEKVFTLILLQDFEGSWVLRSEVEETMCLQVSKTHKVSN